VQVENNQAAFEWGRRCAHDLAAVQALYGAAQGQAAQVIQFVKKPGLAEMVAKRVEFLTGYQNAAYAAEYRAFVDKVQAAETPLGQGTRLTEAVARYLFKLMAYKDEYEVARLHTDGAFSQRIAGMFEGDYRVVHHLAPPSSARKDEQGHLVKKAYGPWMHKAMEVLAKMKGLRGTALDPFGRTEERRTERALIQEYRQCIEGHPRLRPCQGAQPGGGPHQVEGAAGALERAGARRGRYRPARGGRGLSPCGPPWLRALL
jgi:indolepyruvate ferredoxin oxidoreductase